MQSRSALRIRVFPVEPESASFRFVVENVSARAVRGLVLSFCDVLGPGDFGLDDTHMPDSSTDEEVLRRESLEPGERAIPDLEKWGPLSRYRGEMNRTVRCRFADGKWPCGRRRWHTVVVTIEAGGAEMVLQSHAGNPRA